MRPVHPAVIRARLRAMFFMMRRDWVLWIYTGGVRVRRVGWICTVEATHVKVGGLDEETVGFQDLGSGGAKIRT